MQNSEYFKAKLIALKAEISQRIHAIKRDIKHEDMSGNWSEQAIERENDEVLESLGNASEKELAMINTALLRLEAGQYFSCSMCGAKIPSARLELLPFTTRCVNCAQKEP